MDRSSDALTAAMVRLADGDRSAFDAVYDDAWPRVQALCRRMLPDDVADDAAQQAIVRVFERASDYDRRVGPALPWILGVAVWECRSVRRRAGRRREEPLDDLDGIDPRDPEQVVLRAELEGALETVLGTLRAADRETILAAIGRRPRANVAPATYRKRLQRALERLRAAWGRAHG